MEIRIFSNAEAFYEEAAPVLLKNEWENNLLIGLLMQSLKSGVRPLFMAIGYRGGSPLIVCLQTIPKQAVFSFDFFIDRSEADLFAAVLSRKDVKHLLGKNEQTFLLADALVNAKKGRQVNVHMKQRIYALTDVKRSIQLNGVLRKMSVSDSMLVTTWIADFQTCITPGEPLTLEEAKTVAHQQCRKESLYIYEIKGEPVSMANTTRPTNNSITVNLVYTPRNNREKGYASDCVAALSQLCLDQGYETVLLYTDLSNPTSNYIYQKIGFKPVADSISLKLI